MTTTTQPFLGRADLTRMEVATRLGIPVHMVDFWVQSGLLSAPVQKVPVRDGEEPYWREIDVARATPKEPVTVTEDAGKARVGLQVLPDGTLVCFVEDQPLSQVPCGVLQKVFGTTKYAASPKFPMVVAQAQQNGGVVVALPMDVLASKDKE